MAPMAPPSVPSCSRSSPRISTLSRWMWASTNAGSSSLPWHSVARATPAAAPAPIRTIRSPSTTTSAGDPSGRRASCKAHTGGYHSAGTPAPGTGAHVKGERRHGRGNWGTGTRCRLPGGPAAVAADDPSGPATRGGHVRRHGPGPADLGLQPEHSHLLQRRGDIDLPRRHRFQGTELSRIELLVYRVCPGGRLPTWLPANAAGADRNCGRIHRLGHISSLW